MNSLNQWINRESKVDVLFCLFKRNNIGVRNVLFFRSKNQLAEFVQRRWLEFLITKSDLRWFSFLRDWLRSSTILSH